MEELFVEYEKLKKEVNNAKKDYDKALERKALYAYSILPGSSKIDNSQLKIKTTSDNFLEYTIKIEEIEKEIEIRKNLADVLTYRLKLKLLDLRESKEILDKIYVYRYVDNMKVRYICIKTNYSKTQVYRLLEEIRKKTKMGQNGKKFVV